MIIIKDGKEEISFSILKKELKAKKGELEEILSEPAEGTIRLEFSRFGHKYVLTDLS